MKKITLFALFLFPLISQSQITIDTTLSETAKFIAGLDCETEAFKTLQAKDFYKTHKDFTTKVWKELEDETLDPMVKWAKEKNIMEEEDTLPCMYTFSGPDFLFASRFYPRAPSYVLMGLEKCGSASDILKMKDAAISDYLSSIRGSMRYLIKAGYFVTSHMGSDFSKTVLNGNIHMMMLFAARENYNIVSVDYGYMAKDSSFYVTGKKPSTSSGKINGMRVGITDSTANQLKYVYYFSADIADYKIKTKTEFSAFVSSFGPFNSYFKAASYIPAHKNFEIIRNLILEHSNKILQDDTGIPLKKLDTAVFDVQYWGTYTKTISDLSWGFQPDLKKVLEESDNNVDLPFKISYNGNYNEGMMLFAKRKKKD